MNSGLESSLYPAQVYAQFTTNDRGTATSPKRQRKLTNFAKNDIQQQQSTTAESQSGFTPDIIHLFESGEVTLPPNHAKVVIVCSNTKVCRNSRTSCLFFGSTFTLIEFVNIYICKQIIGIC